MRGTMPRACPTTARVRGIRPQASGLRLLAVLAGCGGSTTESAPTTTTTGRRTSTSTATTAHPRPVDPAAPATIITPGEDAPNPFVLVEDGTYHLYASQKEFYGDNLQVRSGPDLHHLGPVHDAMPTLPSWVWAGFTWAPDVRRIGDRYVPCWLDGGPEADRILAQVRPR